MTEPVRAERNGELFVGMPADPFLYPDFAQEQSIPPNAKIVVVVVAE